jgi:arabinoxylan arabinofuranohydrolase
MKPNIPFSSLIILATSMMNLHADYPIASHRYLADPSTLITKDRVYVYCSNDDESPVKGSYNIPNVVCISSGDMKNWTDHGVVFDAEKDTSWAKKTWAPCAIERGGKYYLYFGNGGGNIGVVVGDTPTGPFKDVKKTWLIDGNTPGVQPFQGGWLFDPGVFIDDDGQAYIYFGGNGDDKARVAKLASDMINLDGEVKKLNVKNFFEASWCFKRNGTYYLAYSSNPSAGMRIDYMTSKKPDADFTYAGIIADQPPINDNNNHSAEFLYKGEWYHVYHNRIVAKEESIPTGFRRNIALERFSFNEDGSIKKVEYTVDGVPQVGHLNPYIREEAETFAAQSGIETEKCTAGGMNVCHVENGDWIKIRGVNFSSKEAKRFMAKVASASKGGKIELRLGSPDGKLIGTCEVASTGGWQAWKNTNCNVSGVAGVQDLCLKFTGDEGYLMNLDYWMFQ